MSVKFTTDPALVTSPTLAIYVRSHEWYFWREGKKVAHEHYINPLWRKDYTRDQ